MRREGELIARWGEGGRRGTREEMGMESGRGPGGCNLLSVANTQQMCGAEDWERRGESSDGVGVLQEGHTDCWSSQQACWEPVSSHITPCPET